MARRSKLEALVEVAEDVGRALEAVSKLRKGTNGVALTSLGRAIEREAKRVLALRMRRPRRQPRTNSGKFS